MTAAVAVSVATVWAGPDAPRDVDAAALADVPDPAAWATGLDPAGRRDLHGRTLTQALLGEPVEVVDEHDAWVEVVLPWQSSSLDPRGYPGWMRAAHIGPAPAADGPLGVVVAPTTRGLSGDTGLSYGTVLPVQDHDPGTTRLALAAGGSVRVASAAVREVAAPATDPAAVLASARQFLGLPYLWGGTSGWGLDCSGFVHLVHRVHGVRIPRDASDQADACRPRPLADASIGDLYFFARPGQRPYHVGFVTEDDRGRPTMLHAPEAQDAARIEDEPLAPHRADTLVAAGTFLTG